VIYPTREDIVNLNRRHILETGGEWTGTDNVINSGSLEWVLEAIQYPLFGVQLYPTLAEKASVLAWAIINDHVFLDGCKRTGMSAMEIFIIVNGYCLTATGDDIRDMAVRIATHLAQSFSQDDLVGWIREHISLRPIE
jgi:death on curing protein